MKTQLLSKTILLICIVILSVSCDEKTTDMGTMTITMSNTPNPAVKDTQITFTFDVMMDNMAQAVTNTSCEIIKGAEINTMACTEVMMGQYTGTYTFTQSGTYELHFHYMHEGVDGDMDFTLIVQ